MKWLDALSKTKADAPHSTHPLETTCVRFGPNGICLFDAAYYLEQVGPGSVDATTAFRHYLDHGWLERKNPSRLFDTAYYLDSYPDVAAAGANPLLHYVEHGHKEGRTTRRYTFETVVVPSKPDGERPAPAVAESRQTLSASSLAAFQDDYFVRQAGFLGVAGNIDPAMAREYYVTHTAARRISPNAQFNEMWYLEKYPDVADAVQTGEKVSGFAHFCDAGWAEGRFPAARWLMAAQLREKPDADGEDAQRLLEDDEEAEAFFKAFPFATPEQFVRRVGVPVKTLFLRGDAKPQMRGQFDEDYYREQWAKVSDEAIEDDAFEHYYNTGCQRRLSPNRRFDEAFYMAFYKDIREVVETGRLICGFEHYVTAGRREGRLPRHDLKKALELSIPGVTAPTLLHRLDDVERRTTTPRVTVDDDAPRVFWVVMPRLDPDIAFGGYRALFELVAALRKYEALANYEFRCLLTEVSSSNPDYFLFMTTQAHIREAFTDMECICLDASRPITVSPDDYFLAYSAWDAHIAARLAAGTRHPRFIQLVQEYEAIFHDFSSHHALINAGFSAYPSYPVFNSALLAKFFADHGYGIFSDGRTPRPDDDFLSFEHVPTPARPQTAAAMARHKTRTCLVYARPEGHAARNLFEIVLLALRRACRDGVFEDDWRFIGIGALSEMDPITLSPDHVLEMKTKLPEDEWKALLASVDLGVSLMYAPHPSVVPFELCTTGALVVVNTFLNRDPDYFLSKSQNFVPVAPTIDGVAAGLKEAVARVDDTKSREKNALKVTKATWKDTFSDSVLKTILAGTAAS